MHEKYEKFLVTDFTVFDIETSGLDPLKEEILEIAAVRLRGKEIVATFETLIRPTRPIPPDTTKINGLTELFLLANGQDVHSALDQFLSFSAGSIIVGHNIKDFDWKFISVWAQKLNLNLGADVKFIDTLELSRKMLSLPRYNLATVGKHFGYELVNAHRALPDTEFNAKVFIALMEQMLNSKN